MLLKLGDSLEKSGRCGSLNIHCEVTKTTGRSW